MESKKSTDTSKPSVLSLTLHLIELYILGKM